MLINLVQLSVKVYSLQHWLGVSSHFVSVTSGLDLEIDIVTELIQKSTLLPCVKYSLGITMFSLNPFSLWKRHNKPAKPAHCSRKSQKVFFWTNLETNYSNPVDSNRKKNQAHCLQNASRFYYWDNVTIMFHLMIHLQLSSLKMIMLW